MCCVQAELGQLGVRREEGGSEGERGEEREGEGERGEEVDTSVWEEQLQKELQDLDIEVRYIVHIRSLFPSAIACIIYFALCATL